MVLRVLTTFALAGAVAGCGGGSGSELERVSVTGTVTRNGQAVPSGQVVMIPATGASGPSASAQVTDGVFTISAERGPIAIGYDVTVTVEVETAGVAVNSEKPGMPVDGATATQSVAQTFYSEFSDGLNEVEYTMTVK